MGQQYRDGNIKTAFDYEGWYKGDYFRRDYYENGKKVMSINSKMKPNDGVIEGFILQKIEDDAPYLYIFLDEDWKNEIPNTKVHWGFMYRNELKFTFNSVSKGIYMMKIEDDEDRFDNNYTLSSGGVYVGDWNENNSTVISFY